LAPKAFRVETGTVAAVYSLLLAACGGFVFYASVRPVPMPSGVLDIPWFAVLLALAITWLAVPVALLALGLAYLRPAGPQWRSLVAAGGQLAAGAAMIALLAASARKATPTAGTADGTFVGSAR
jgi:hypothetical protein